MAMIQIKEQQKEIAIKVALAVVLVAALFVMAVLPPIRESAKLRVEIQESQERLELHSDLSRAKKNLQTLEATLGSLSGRSALLGKISDIATKKQLEVQTLTPKTIDEGNYVRFKIEMEATATFFSMVKFLQAMESISPPIGVKDVTLLRRDAKRKGRLEGKRLQVQLILETFLMKQKKAGVKS